jgi:hypothetical protein
MSQQINTLQETYPFFMAIDKATKKYFIFGAQKMTVENYLIFSDK